MNWFSKIYKNSSWNIRFSEEIESDIEQIIDVITKYYFKKTPGKEAFNWEFVNPYTNSKDSVLIAILPKSKNKEQIALYDLLNNIINIYPFNLKTDIKDENIIKNAFKNALQHEVAHKIDPKIKTFKTPKNKYEYYTSRIEFDGYSKQIIEDLKSQIKINPAILTQIINWLRMPSENILPIKPYEEILSYWAQHDKNNNSKYIKTLKTRIYNELHGDKK
jgi:hypothetical protein